MRNAHRLKIAVFAALLLVMLAGIGPGCIQYDANIHQRFLDNGTAILNVRERMHIDETQAGEYAATLQNSSDSRLGNRWVSGIMAYYNNGAYAQDLCARARGTHCEISSDGVVVWNATLPADGRFFTQGSQTDWLYMVRESHYEIGRVPLLHYQAYSENTPSETAQMEWAGLRRFLQTYMQEADGNNSSAAQETESMLADDGPLRKTIDRYAPVRVVEQVLDLNAGQIRARKFEDLNASANGNRIYSVNLDYTVEFPSPITSAYAGDTVLNATGERTLSFDLNQIQSFPKGTLVIVTQKSLSPLGIYTWVIPIFGIVVTLLREFFLGTKKIWKEDEA